MNNVLKSNTCICGARFEENDEVWQKIAALLERGATSASVNRFRQADNAAANITGERDHFLKSHRQIEQRRKRLDEEIKGLQSQIEENESQIVELPEEDIARLQREIKEHDRPIAAKTEFQI